MNDAARNDQKNVCMVLAKEMIQVKEGQADPLDFLEKVITSS